jgi:hypothetical protein
MGADQRRHRAAGDDRTPGGGAVQPVVRHHGAPAQRGPIEAVPHDVAPGRGPSDPRAAATRAVLGDRPAPIDELPSAPRPDPSTPAPSTPAPSTPAPRSIAADLGAPPAPTPQAPVAALFETLRPGGALAVLLEDLDLAALDDGDLVEATAAALRLKGWAQAYAARAAALLSEQPSMNPVWSAAAGGAPSEAGVAGDELAMRLACSRRSATRLVRHGRAFARALTPTGDALAAGEIALAAAEVIADRLVDEPMEIALDVQDRVLPGAGRRTPTQVARDVAAALVVVDPAEAAERTRRAHRRRCVYRPRVLPDGMAGLTAVLPAATAARIDATLDAAARTARRYGDPRTLDQLRADGLTDLVLHTACVTREEGGGTLAVLAERAGADVAGTAAARAGTAHDADPGTALGAGMQPHPGAGTASEPQPDGSARTLPGTTPLPGTAPQPGAHHQPGANHDPAHDTPDPDLLDRTAPSADAPAADVPTTCATAPHHRTEVRVTVALSTLLGVDDLPADLAGYGAIDATAARALAEGGTWRRLVTDPLSGTVLDVGRTRYRPPPALARHVRLRDGVCARPGCPASAETCDLDHTVEYHAPPAGTPPGATSADNLGPLCRRDHRLKTDGGFVLRQPAPGVFEWTTPTGHRYRVVPGRDGRHEHLGRATGPRPAATTTPAAAPPF